MATSLVVRDERGREAAVDHCLRDAACGNHGTHGHANSLELFMPSVFPPLKAGSIEDLAESMGLPPAKLRAMVALKLRPDRGLGDAAFWNGEIGFILLTPFRKMVHRFYRLATLLADSHRKPSG